MSDHDDCPANMVLPMALTTLEHIHRFHSEHEITAYVGQGGAITDIYIVSGSAREKFTELKDSLRQKNEKDISELARMFNLKPSRKGSASGTAHKSRSTTPKNQADV